MRYIDADKLKIIYASKDVEKFADDFNKLVNAIPTADVRENVKAKKLIGGGEHDGATCWFECSHCHGSVDIEDAYCKHCGAVLEYERGEQNG